MNIVVWIVQGLLAFLCVAGGAFKAFKPDDVAKQAKAISHSGWRAIGAFEIVCGLLLVVPHATAWMPLLTPLAAAALLVECLALSAVYGRVSTKLTGANPLVYSAVMALLAAFVAYGRYAAAPAA